MTNPPTVLAIGETMAMLTPDPPVRLALDAKLRLDIGGAEANVASHLAALGVPAAWAGAVGDDAPGRIILETLASRGVDVRWVRRDPDAPTGIFLKDPSPDGTEVLYYRSGSAASRLRGDFADTLPLDAPLVHLSGITQALSDGCRELIDTVILRRRSEGLPISYDVNHRPALWRTRTDAAESLRDEASRCDIVFVGTDEAAALWGVTEPAAIRALLPEPEIVVVKDSARAAYSCGRNRTVTVPATVVDVVEPVGAGDAFAAGYLASWLSGRPPAVALAHGHARAATALTSTGDM